MTHGVFSIEVERAGPQKNRRFFGVVVDNFFLFSLSLLFHILLMSVIYSYSIKEERKAPPFFARVVTPEELSLPGVAKPPVPHQKNKERTVTTPPVMSLPPAEIPSGTGHEAQVSKDNRLPEAISPVKKSGGESNTSGPLARLFDRNIIAEQIEKEAIKEKPPEITFDTKEFRYQSYMNRLKEKIESIWQYPRSARERGIYGDLYIRFSIKKDGSLGRVDLVRTSGYRELDEAALRALRDGAPYWPLPSEWGLDEFIIEGHFIYTLYGYYIR